METAWNGVRDVFRSRIRSVLVILILGLTVATLVTLNQIAAGIAEVNRQLQAELSTLIEVRAAGSTAMGKGADPLPEAIVRQLGKVPHVVKVDKFLFNRSDNPGGRFPVWVVVGMEPGKPIRVNSHGEVGTPTIFAGRSLEPDDLGRAVAVVGTVWAAEYEARTGRPVRIGTRLTLEGSEIPRPVEVEVVGFYRAGFVFGDSQVIVPLPLAQQMTAQEGKVTNIFVTVDAVGNVEAVEQGLREALGEAVDILIGRENVRMLSEGLAGIQANAALSAVVALVAGALIVLLTMVLVTRQRTWEIGMLKAMGASGGDVARRFVAEAVALGTISAALGLALFALMGPRVGEVFLSAARFTVAVAIPGFSEQSAAELPVRYGLSWAVLGYAIGMAVLFGAVGSLYPVMRALRLRPAEALRHV
jgi:ABC-type lipoprotein release transport system permease subunit